MARIEMLSTQPDGTPHYVDLRDRLMSADRFAVQEAALVEVGAGKNKASFLALENDMRNTLLARMITGWSFPAPVPSANSFQAADVVLGEVLDLDDYAVLEKAVQPFMDRISGQEPQDPKKPSGS